MKVSQEKHRLSAVNWSTVTSSNLSPSERQVLGALIMDKGRGVEDRTVEAVANRTGLDQGVVYRTLEGLEQLDPPLVHRDTDSVLNVEFWIALEAAIGPIETPPPVRARITGHVRPGVSIDTVSDVSPELRLGDSFRIGQDRVQIVSLTQRFGSESADTDGVDADWMVEPIT